MRNYRSTYTYPPRRRRMSHHERDQWRCFWLVTIVVLTCILGAARLDYIAQRDCGSNQACLDAVMP